MRSSQLTLHSAICAVLLAVGVVAAAAPVPDPGWHWVASWSAAQQIPEPHNVLPSESWRDASLRQIVHLSLGGSRLRVRISNAFGTAPLVLDAASVALARAPGGADVDPSTARTLSFDGRTSVSIPAGAEYYSDVVVLNHAAGADLAVSMYFKGEPARQTGHPGSRSTSFVAKGLHVQDAVWPDAVKVTHWYQLTDVEVQAPRAVGAVVAIGDSITDGNGSTTDGNNRWPDQLSARLLREGRTIGVVNTGIGGGRMLTDGLGPNLASRFDRDVLARSGVTHAIVFIGVNDLGVMHRNADDTPEGRKKMVDELLAAHRQLVERAHAQEVCVIGATITPYGGSGYYSPTAANEADRQSINTWIRGSGVFDGVADFDAAVRDPAETRLIRKEHDSGDGLHLSPAGYRALADAVPIPSLLHCDAGR